MVRISQFFLYIISNYADCQFTYGFLFAGQDTMGVMIIIAGLLLVLAS